MSHLYDILNPDSTRKHAEILSVETEPIDSQSSSAEDDISPTSDDEIDELDEETGDEDDYDEPSPVPILRPVAQTVGDLPSEVTQTVPATDRSKLDVKEDQGILRKEEKQKTSVPAPRRKLEKHDRKIDLGLHDHKAHADCPDTLACLPDTHGRPQHTLPVILRCAILGSPRKRLTIREIYATMESKYPYYKSAGQTWKVCNVNCSGKIQSVRHHLSLNRLFERQPRPVTDPGFGSYWTVNLSAPPGTKRPRKRGRPNKDTADGSNSLKKGLGSKFEDQSPTSQLPTAPTKYHFQPQTHPAPPPPPLPLPQVNTLSSSPLMLQAQPHPQPQHPPHPQALSQPPPPPQSRQHPSFPQQSTEIIITHNSQFQAHIQPTMYQQPQLQHLPYQSSPKSSTFLRPHHPHDTRQHSHSHSYETDLQNHRKPSTPVTPISGRESTYPPSSKDSEAEDGSMHHETDTNGPTISEDEFESEEEMVHPYIRRDAPVGAFVPTRPSPIFSLPPFSTLEHNREDIIEHMRQEIANLRRTSAEAVSTSLRLTEQLANANLEVSRSREAVRDLEDMLQNETMKRKDVERMKDQEIERRRAAEHALSSIAARSPTRTRPT